MILTDWIAIQEAILQMSAQGLALAGWKPAPHSALWESENAKAKLAVRLAKIDLRKYLEGDYVQDKRNIDGEVLLAEEELRRAEERLQYSERLNKKDYVSSGEVEADRVAVTKAKNTMNVAKEKLRVLEEFSRERQEAELTSNADETEREMERTKRSQASAVSKAQSDFRGAAATTAVEKALLDKLKQQLEHCEVKAPADGILVYDRSRPWDTSGRIQPGGIVHFQRILFSLPDLAQMQVKVKIHESSVKKVKPDQQAEIRVDAHPDAVLHGTVKSVATLADNRGFWDQRGVKEYESIVMIQTLPEEAGLKPGMTAEIKLLVNHLSDLLLVPIQAVAENEGEHFCFVVSGKKVERRKISAGENNEKFVEIKSGLAETVVLSGTGGVLGVGLGIALSFLVTHFFSQRTILTAWSPLLAFTISVAVGVIFGTYPARRAALMDPIEALRHE